MNIPTHGIHTAKSFGNVSLPSLQSNEVGDSSSKLSSLPSLGARREEWKTSPCSLTLHARAARCQIPSYHTLAATGFICELKRLEYRGGNGRGLLLSSSSVQSVGTHCTPRSALQTSLAAPLYKRNRHGAAALRVPGQYSQLKCMRHIPHVGLITLKSD